MSSFNIILFRFLKDQEAFLQLPDGFKATHNIDLVDSKLSATDDFSVRYHFFS